MINKEVLKQRYFKGFCEGCLRPTPSEGRVYACLIQEGVLTPCFEYCLKHGTNSLMVKTKCGVFLSRRTERVLAEGVELFVKVNDKPIGFVSLTDYVIDFSVLGDEIVEPLTYSEIELEGMILNVKTIN